MSASSLRPVAASSNPVQPSTGKLEGVGTEAPDTFHAALIECVRAAGGSKVIAADLWPAKARANLEAARQYLAACLNPDRAEKLALDEVLFILHAARDRGCHVGMQFLAASLGYAEPTPVEPEDERAKLQRQFIDATATLAAMAKRIESLGRAAG